MVALYATRFAGVVRGAGCFFPIIKAAWMDPVKSFEESDVA